MRASPPPKYYQGLPKIVLLVLVCSGMASCSIPIWNKFQKRAARQAVVSVVHKPASSVILNAGSAAATACGGDSANTLFLAGIEDLSHKQQGLLDFLLFFDSFSQWQQYWVPEAEKPAAIRYLPKGRCLDIKAPLGLTLWCKQPFEGNVRFHFQIRAVVAGDSLDRCSDLNFFWMATDPQHPDSIFARADFRGGIFGNAYSLSLYYLGFGGNSNTTTRFRKYDGDLEAFRLYKKRPPVLKEYTDSSHLIRPNHWYSMDISICNDAIECTSDEEVLVHYLDPTPLKKGWFAFRTTQNHLQIRNFVVTKP